MRSDAYHQHGAPVNTEMVAREEFFDRQRLTRCTIAVIVYRAHLRWEPKPDMDLNTYMAEHGLSDSDMGRLLKKPPQTVNRWRRGLRRPRSPADLQAIERATNGAVTIASFFVQSDGGQ